jgi:hypothetical protein
MIIMKSRAVTCQDFLFRRRCHFWISELTVNITRAGGLRKSRLVLSSISDQTTLGA